MPKVLSLKKASQVAPPKNQKAITQFFKNIDSSQIQKSQTSPAKDLSSKYVENKSVKRKAVSPIKTIDLVDDSFVSSTLYHDCSKTTHNVPEKNAFQTPKKFKLECSSMTSHPNKDVLRKEVKTSPPKGTCTHFLECNVLSPSREKNIEMYVSSQNLDKKKDRSPLTPVELSNVLEYDDTSSIVSQNAVFSLLENENHVFSIDKRVSTPKKIVQSKNKDENSLQSPVKINRTPKKSPKKESSQSPRKAKTKTLKNNIDEYSPSKSGSTVKTLELSPNLVDDMFGDDWDFKDVDQDCREDLDLNTMQRCQVVSVKRHSNRLELKLKNDNNNRATCFVEGIWVDTPILPEDIISVVATRDTDGHYSVNNTSGLLVLRPDHLMSSTSVVAGVFCKRKALLQERWRGIDSANTAMTIGILIHELVQKALTQHIMDASQLGSEVDRVLKESVQMLYDAGLCEDEARSNIQMYIPPLAEFMRTYVGNTQKGAGKFPKEQWNGHIEKVLDIEENICCPQLGLKGKIDATVQVTIHERKGRQRAIVPLELKSGKASVSAEHRGQLVLYGMMLSLLRNEDPAQSVQRGLLLYLKERVDLREVSCGYPERRDLMMLRNELVNYLAPGPGDIDPEQLTDIEDASCLLQQRLPEPVHHENACTKCPYLTICSLHLWHTDGPSVSESHPLSKLQNVALGHLSPEHIKYFLHWTALLKMEERGQMMTSPLHTLWTDNVEKRVQRGTCAANLKLKTVTPSGDRHVHVFVRQIKEIETLNSDNRTKGPQEGEFSIVSTDNRPWIAAGVVIVTNDKEISILLERDLSKRISVDTMFHIDTYESYATAIQNLTNLGVLLEDSDRAQRLRRIIINKNIPEFEKKLPREVGRLGTKLMRSLNIEQQRAVLKALAAKDYALLQGLPGTGKTQTVSVLIQMLVGLKQRVLVTAHTHSAVDTVLSRLPESLRVMRLGSASRVAASLQKRCEQNLISSCETPEKLEKLYSSMEVIGVTCLGANHALLARTTFDVCIVDEATQVLQCTVLRPLFAAKRFVLVGDPEQLPPVVRSRAARRLGMEESLFHRLMSEEATSTLQLQYRMNQPLTDVANRVAYSSRLKCANESVARASLDVDIKKLSHHEEWLKTACSPEPEHAAVFLDLQPLVTDQNNKNCSNVDEACVVLALVDALIEIGVKPSEIGVIAPYRDQVSLFRRALCKRGAEGSTVDQFQGRDKSVIVFSCTKHAGNDSKKNKEGEILSDQRRLAVSVTRAKHKLLVVGDSRAIKRYAPLQRLTDACARLHVDKDTLSNVFNKYKIDFF